MNQLNKQLSLKMLVIYMISTLLFLTSIELHIHTQKAAASADHGAAVSISSLSSELMPAVSGEEIKVSPDGVLKVNQSSINLIAVFLLLAVMLVILCQVCISRLRDSNAELPLFQFHGTPPLRAPPL